MKVECLRTIVHSGTTSYPIYIGFCPAERLSEVAAAPSFTDSTTNATIAENVLMPPVSAWQRPLISASISAIAETFNNTGRLMPNSVLLAKNPQSAVSVTPKQQTVNGTTPTDVWEIELSAPAAGQPLPLWILDGQHRIHGMTDSLQRDNPIPFVLLLNEDTTSYAETRLAEIFAQVTTTAASLDPLHNEWMSYAFKLGKYASSAKDADAHRSAMKTAAVLCMAPQLDDQGTANPFRDRIKFNPKKSPASFPNGFAYDCVDMEKLLYRAYFGSTPASGVSRLSPDEVAKQLGTAYNALQGAVKAPQDKTVFFGDRDHAYRIMQDAFVVGVCARLLQNALPIDWPGLLQSLRFNTSNWNFKSWVLSMSGSDQTTSKDIAEQLFLNYFKLGTLSGQADLVDLLKGHGAQFDVQVEVIKPSGRVDSLATEKRELTKGANLSLVCTAGAKRKIKIPKSSIALNIGKIVAIDDGASTAANRVLLPKIQATAGLVMDSAESPQPFTNPLSIKFDIHLFGGIKVEADLSVEWM